MPTAYKFAAPQPLGERLDESPGDAGPRTDFWQKEQKPWEDSNVSSIALPAETSADTSAELARRLLLESSTATDLAKAATVALELLGVCLERDAQTVAREKEESKQLRALLKQKEGALAKLKVENKRWRAEAERARAEASAACTKLVHAVGSLEELRAITPVRAEAAGTVEAMPAESEPPAATVAGVNGHEMGTGDQSTAASTQPAPLLATEPVAQDAVAVHPAVDESSIDSESLEQATLGPLWTAHWSCQLSVQGHTGYVSSVCFSPGGETIVSGGGFQDHSVKIWDAATGECVQTLKGHRGAVMSVCFSAGGE
eukprot:SAG31_NODE_5895_length_2268_cov_2.761641_1_plen_314_part_10